MVNVTPGSLAERLIKAVWQIGNCITIMKSKSRRDFYGLVAVSMRDPSKRAYKMLLVKVLP
jgi:hypothetical protein